MSTGAASRTATILRRFACFVFGASAVYVATLPFTGRIEAQTPVWIIGAPRWRADLIVTWSLLVALLVIAFVRIRADSIAWPLIAATWTTIAAENVRQSRLTVEPFGVWIGAIWIAVVAVVVAVFMRDVRDRAAFGSEKRRGFIGLCIALAITAITASIATNLGFRAAVALRLPSMVAYYVVAAVAGCICFAFAWALHALKVEAGISRGSDWHVSAEDAFRMVLIAPVFEEIIIRGVLWAALRRVSSEMSTLLVTAVVFALMHAVSGVFAVPGPLIGGLMLGVLRSGTKSVTPTILAHIVWNALGVALMSDALR